MIFLPLTISKSKYTNMNPFNSHESFFSSLTHLENRLLSENENQTNQNTNEPINSISPLSSPLFLTYTTQKPTNNNTDTAVSSGPPLDFLSNSPSRFKSENSNEETTDADELIGLLNFSPTPSRNPQKCSPFSLSAAINSCDDGFYRNVVGVKGPRCKEEMKRLDGWIELYRKEKREPARLAHLIIAKAVADYRSCEFYGVEFPETVNEFLDVDPSET